MYADRESGGATKISVKERLNIADSGRRRQITGKRQRQDDDKWEHDLYDHDNPQVSNRRVGARDLRLKLQKNSIQSTTQSGNGSLSGGIRDLREKLSGAMTSQPVDTAPPKPRAVPEGSKPPRKVAVEAPVPETKKVASMVSKKKSQHKVESVDSFLRSLGLEKYSITFQAEEVDMATLLHMNDDDLKAMGIPMGPRKKILLALDSKV